MNIGNEGPLEKEEGITGNVKEVTFMAKRINQNICIDAYWLNVYFVFSFVHVDVTGVKNDILGTLVDVDDNLLTTYFLDIGTKIREEVADFVNYIIHNV